MSLFDEVNFATLPRLRGLLEEWFPAGRLSGSEFECGDLNGNAGRSFKVNLNTGRWADFAGDVKAAIRSLSTLRSTTWSRARPLAN
jgi:putative DNA primase/helicase